MSIEKDLDAEHALFVGGSGMLADLSMTLASRCRHVSVLARSGPRLDGLARRRGNIHAIQVDYTRLDPLRRTLEAQTVRLGPFDLAVCWVRSEALQTMDEIANAIGTGGRVVHVRPCIPAGKDEGHLDLRSRHRQLRWQAVRLGHQVSLDRWPPTSRWLTHAEICAGVLSAIESETEDLWVGLPSEPEGMAAD